MKNRKKILGIAMTALVFGLPTVALAASVGGGEWHFGVGYTGTYGYSNYNHPSKTHSASVALGSRTVKETQGAGTWAKASITKIPPTGMNYYWKTY